MANAKKELKEVLKGILLAIIIYFVIQVSLVVSTGVDNPISVVISGSMDHKGYDFDQWWDIKESEYHNYGINKDMFELFPCTNGFSKGDLLLIKSIHPTNIKVGDVIVFQRENDSIPIVHRVVHISMYQDVLYFLTKGDYNPVADNYYSGSIQGINEEHVIGKVRSVFPDIGNITLWFRGVLGQDA